MLKIQGITMKNFVSWATWQPRFVDPWYLVYTTCVGFKSLSTGESTINMAFITYGLIHRMFFMDFHGLQGKFW